MIRHSRSISNSLGGLWGGGPHPLAQKTGQVLPHRRGALWQFMPGGRSPTALQGPPDTGGTTG